MNMKNVIIILIVLILIALGVYYFFPGLFGGAPVTTPQGVTSKATQPQGGTQAEQTSATPQNAEKTVIGKSVEGRPITAYYYGTGSKKILFVGGIHGGYEWNTALVAYDLMDYLKANPNAIPSNEQVAVIPVLNPDGLNKVVGTADRFSATDVTASAEVQVSGRFNANNVDLDRNFDCNWQPHGVWQTKAVSGGSAVFSEPESQAVRDYVTVYKPDAVVVWYSAAGGVFASSCGGEVLPETTAITNAYAKASGYPAHQSFNYYKITGDMVDWLAKNKIPAISVLLSTHTDVEWDKNLAGIKALLKHYAP